jgi:hypothetical protein
VRLAFGCGCVQASLLLEQWLLVHGCRQDKRALQFNMPPTASRRARPQLLAAGVLVLPVTHELPHDVPYDCLLQALLQHNHVIKQAADDNIGSVLEQEGDSFALAFHDPHDAAAFALQVGNLPRLCLLVQCVVAT